MSSGATGMTELWVSHNGRPLAGARQLAARRFPNGRPPEASRQPRPAGRRLMEIVLSTSPAPAAPRARVAGGAEEPLLARRIRSSKRRRRDAYGAPRRRRTRARSRRLSLWLRERLYSTRANAALSDLVQTGSEVGTPATPAIAAKEGRRPSRSGRRPVEGVQMRTFGEFEEQLPRCVQSCFGDAAGTARGDCGGADAGSADGSRGR